MLQEREDNIYEQKADHKLLNEASCYWKKKKKKKKGGFDVPLSEDRVVPGYTHTHRKPHGVMRGGEGDVCSCSLVCRCQSEPVCLPIWMYTVSMCGRVHVNVPTLPPIINGI